MTTKYLTGYIIAPRPDRREFVFEPAVCPTCGKSEGAKFTAIWQYYLPILRRLMDDLDQAEDSFEIDKEGV